MTQEQRIDKTIEISTRIMPSLIDKWFNFPKSSDSERLYLGKAAVEIAKAIISEAEKEDAK